MLLTRRIIVPILAVLVLALGAVMFIFVGRDFYPAIDGGMIQLHVRAPPGTRIEVTEQIFQAVEDKIREVIPKKDLDLIVDNIGVPARSYNWAFADGTTIAVNDGVIMVSLKEGHAPTADYVRKLREVLPAAFPEDLFYFQPADMATQILNFGLTAQIDVRTVGYDRVKNLRIAEELRRRIAAIPGVVDAHLQQEVYAPGFLRPDRSRAGSAVRHHRERHRQQHQHEPQLLRAGLSPTSGPIRPTAFPITSRCRRRNTRSARWATSAIRRSAPEPRRRRPQPVPGELSNVATFTRDSVPGSANQANIQPVYEVYASTQGRDLGSIATEIDKITTDLQETALARQHDPGDRPDRQHEPGLPRHDDRPVVRGCLRLPADGRQLPEFR